MCTVRLGIKLKWRELNAIADFLDRRGDDRRWVLRMAEFEVHPAADILKFQHRSAPCGARNRDMHRLGAELRMARKQGLAASEQNGGIAMMHGLNLEHSRGREIAEKNAAFDF